MTVKHKLLYRELKPKQKEMLTEYFPELFNDGLDPKKFDLTLESRREPSIVYHYTSLNTLQAILDRLEKEEKLNNPNPLLLRGTRIDYLNDATEYKLACEIMTDMLKKHAQSINDGDSKKIVQYADTNIWERIATTFGQLTLPFITSFSENDDNLPMWNTYGANGLGVAIGLKKVGFKERFTAWSGCSYINKYFKWFMHKYVEEIYDNLSYVNSNKFVLKKPEIFNKLNSYLSSLKHNAYEYENEWRLIQSLQKNGNSKEIKYQEVNGLLKPYIEHGFEKSVLKEIVIGPCANLALAKQSLSDLLEQKGFSTKDCNDANYVKVKGSEIPFRQI